MSVREAIDYYHQLLESRYLDSTREILYEESVKHSLIFGERAVCNVLRPYLIDRKTYNFVRKASLMIMQAIAAVGERLQVDAQLRREIDLDAQEEAVALIPSGFGNPDVSARLDGFISPQGDFHFVEYNAESPGGLAYGDVLSEIFMSMPIMKEFTKSYQCSTFPIRERVYQHLLAAYRRWGGVGTPNIAIVDWKGASTYSEFVMMKNKFEQHGCRVIICDPDELEYTGGKLQKEDFKVDMIYKRVLISELLARSGPDHQIFRAARDRAVCISNGMGVQLLFKKAIFALLSDPNFVNLFNDEVATACSTFIPWTRRMRACKTVYKGEWIDLVEYTANNRERLVLKPNSEYGGKGVVLGWEVTDEEWNRTIQMALDGACYIVQERVPLGREVYPSYIDGRLILDERYVDIDPYVWNGTEIEGGGVRLSKMALLNVSAGGGSATPLILID